MNILMLTCQFMPEVFGGAEQQCLKQAAELVARGHKVTVVTSRTKWSVPAREVMQGVDVRRLMTWRAPDLLGRFVPFTFIWIFGLLGFGLVNRGKFDIVHCHQAKFGVFAAALLAWVLGVPMVAKPGNSNPFMDLEALRKKKVFGPIFLKLALMKKPQFVAISSVIEQDLKDFGIPAQRITKIVNGVIEVKPTYKAPAPKALKFFWHGRFEPIKNLKLMVEGFAEAGKVHKGITLNLFGSGSQQAELAALAEKLGIGERLVFVAPNKQVLKTIGGFDVFINTSYAEGMSNSMLEAMASGKIVLSTRVSGAAEIIDEGKNGFIIKAYTPKAIAHAIDKVVGLSGAEMKAMFKHNIAKTRDEFAIARVVDQYEAVYRQLV